MLAITGSGGPGGGFNSERVGERLHAVRGSKGNGSAGGQESCSEARVWLGGGWLEVHAVGEE